MEGTGGGGRKRWAPRHGHRFTGHLCGGRRRYLGLHPFAFHRPASRGPGTRGLAGALDPLLLTGGPRSQTLPTLWLPRAFGPLEGRPLSCRILFGPFCFVLSEAAVNVMTAVTLGHQKAPVQGGARPPHHHFPFQSGFDTCLLHKSVHSRISVHKALCPRVGRASRTPANAPEAFAFSCRGVTPGELSGGRCQQGDRQNTPTCAGCSVPGRVFSGRKGTPGKRPGGHGSRKNPGSRGQVGC